MMGKKWSSMHIKYTHTSRLILTYLQEIVNALGIKYLYSVPQSMGDCWWFLGCENVPDALPDFIYESSIDPETCVGYGLSKEMADVLGAWMKRSADA